ncbi:MAG: preprotein translocase subunit YajC [Tissierellia bacterium]|nr:preprotein translocase subunit YajC [Tissierellia bacterium]
MNILAISGESLPVIGIGYIVIIGLITYFFLMKPAKKKRNEFNEMIKQLKVGDEIITKSGVKGTIVEVDDVYFTISTGNGAEIQYVVNALNYIVKPVSGMEEETNMSQEEMMEEAEAQEDEAYPDTDQK